MNLSDVQVKETMGFKCGQNQLYVTHEGF